MTSRLSIIIVNYRSEDALEHCLRSIHVATDQSVEIILVDNSPGGGAEAVLKQSGLPGLYFPQGENIGYTKAANLGARRATGELVCFLNPDTLLKPGVLDHMLDWLEHHPRAVVGPRERNGQGNIVTTCFPFVNRRYIWGANLLYKFPWPRSWQPGLGWLVPPYRYAHLCRTVARPAMVPVLSGSCLMMKRSVWEEVGEWNEQLTYFGLESEWFTRAAELGVQAWYVPAAEIFHEHALSINRGVHWQVREEAEKNRRWYAATFGSVVVGILALVLGLERFFRQRRQ